MRPTISAMLGLVLALSLSTCGVAEESRSWWWPFGGDDPPPADSAPTTTDPASEGSRPSWPTMPTMGWPELPTFDRSSPDDRPQRRAMVPGRGKPTARTRNSWTRSRASAQANEPIAASPWETVSEGVQRVGQGTQNAWRKTVDVLTPGGSANPHVAQREPHPPWWKRMWGGENDPQDGPRTVTEWMAQERLDP